MAARVLFLILVTSQAAVVSLSASADGLDSCSVDHDEQAAMQISILKSLKKEGRNPKWNINMSLLELHNPSDSIAGVNILNADEADSSTYGSDRPYWNLVLASGAWDSTLKDLCGVAAHNLDCRPLGHPDVGGLAMVEIHGTRADLKALFEQHGLAKEIAFAEPDMPVHVIPDDVSQEPAGSVLLDDPTDASFVAAASATGTPWGLVKIGVPGRTTGGKGVHVYVLDTGVRTTHQDFGGRAVPTLDSTGRSPVECNGRTSCAVDRHGHGTHCAGTVGGTTYGVAHQSTLHGVKVLSDSGSGSISGIVNAMDWVLTKGQRPAVVSMSLGGRGQSSTLKVAVEKLTNSNPGVTVVVAAGNSNRDACQYSPAFVPSAITVGSSTSSMSRSSFSNYGKCLDIFAPGSSVRSTCAGSDTSTCTKSGTSMACPHVAGAAALLLEKNKDWTPVQVQARMTAMALSGAISGVGTGSPNLFLKVDGQVTPTPPEATPAPPCTAPPTPAPPTPAPPTPAPC